MDRGTASGWIELVLVVALFFGSHLIPARPLVRARLKAILGERAYLAAYSAVSLALLAWLFVAAGRVPAVVLWDTAPWQLWVPIIVMPFVCVLLAFGVGAAHPLSILGTDRRPFDPGRPGIAGITRHPVLWAFTLWALAHIVPNGDLAHVLLFGLFAAFGAAGMAVVERRRRRTLGMAEWQRLARRTSLVPFAALINGRWHPELRALEAFRLAGAVALYLGFLILHAPVIGVSPLP